MKQIIAFVVGFILLVTVIVTSIFWDRFFGIVDANTDRIIHEESLTYNEGVADDLAKYKLEMITAEDEVEKKAIAQMVVERFANYDESNLNSDDLKQFLEDCRNLELGDY